MTVWFSILVIAVLVLFGSSVVVWRIFILHTKKANNVWETPTYSPKILKLAGNDEKIIRKNGYIVWDDKQKVDVEKMTQVEIDEITKNSLRERGALLQEKGFWGEYNFSHTNNKGKAK